jgi:hypothetical protein
MVRFMIVFTSCFTIGKPYGWGTFSKEGAGLDYYFILGF